RAVTLIEKPETFGLSTAGLKNVSSQLYDPTRANGNGINGKKVTARNVLWTALPGRLILERGLQPALETADTELPYTCIAQTQRGQPIHVPTRIQCEYCEWHVVRERGVIRRVLFTTETLEYWWALALGYPPGDFGPAPRARKLDVNGNMETVLRLYHDHVSED